MFSTKTYEIKDLCENYCEISVTSSVSIGYYGKILKQKTENEYTNKEAVSLRLSKRR